MDWAASAGRGGNWGGAFDRFTRAALRGLAGRLPLAAPPFWQGQLIALACVLGGAGLRLALDPLAHGHIPIIIFYPCVLVASVFGGSWSGVTALLLGAIVSRMFWLPPSGISVTLIAYGGVSLFGVFMARLLRTLVEIHVDGEQRARLLTNEINHRANNLLSVIQAISAQTARGAPSVEDYRDALETRLRALARAQHLVSRELEAAPDLQELLASIVEPFGAERFELEGPASAVPHPVAPSLALLLHELCTNAVKYGALSCAEGRVSISWTAGGSRVRLLWREQAGPPVVAPTRSGFGSRLTGMAFRPEQGQAAIAFDPDGVRCTVEFAIAG
jgi:two-component sensor histidine kinase